MNEGHEEKFLAVYLSGPEFAILTSDGVYEDHSDRLFPDWIPVLHRFPNHTLVLIHGLYDVHTQIMAAFPANKVRLVTFEEMRCEFERDDDGVKVPTPELMLEHMMRVVQN